MSVKWVVLDLGGVVLPSPFGILKDMGISKEHFFECVQEWEDLEKGFLKLSEFVTLFQQRTNHDIAPFFKRMGEALPNPLIVHCISKLRESGYKIGCITNNFNEAGANDLARMKDFYANALFDVVVESSKEHCRKGKGMQHRRIFDIFIERADYVARSLNARTTFSDCVYIDDLAQNLEAPKQLGMQTFHCQSPKIAAQKLIDTFNLRVPSVGDCPDAFRLDAGRLFDFIKKTIPDAVPQNANKLVVQKFAFGQSNPTYLLFFQPIPSLRFEDHALVLRKQPPGKLLPGAHDVLREYRIMHALQSTAVPVPYVLAFCDDITVLGTSFYLMKYINGKVHVDPTLPGTTPAVKRRLYDEMIRVLVEIHQAPLNLVSFLGSSRNPEKFLERQVKIWTLQYTKSKTQHIAKMDALIQQCHDAVSQWKPMQWELGICHGDFRLDNMIFDHDTHRCLAVVDWELASCGGVLTDLVSMLLAHPITPLGGLNLHGQVVDYTVDKDLPQYKQLLLEYSDLRCIAPIPTRLFQLFTAVQFFRLCGILQGIIRRQDQGSSTGDKQNQSRFTVEAVAGIASLGLSALHQDGKL